MQTFNVVMCALLALSIVLGTVFGSKLLALPYRTRLAIMIGYVLFFGGWIVASHA